jgi:predicted Zn-dependent protease
MASFFDKLARDQTGLPSVLNMLSTHPSSAERAAALKALLKDAPALPPLGGDWSALQASLPR